ncbi:MAG: GGDEF domain-containing protein [Anaerolineales bacterium]|jgi:diguanylate cyclase (GGDEF)-like protein
MPQKVLPPADNQTNGTPSKFSFTAPGEKKSSFTDFKPSQRQSRLLYYVLLLLLIPLIASMVVINASVPGPAKESYFLLDESCIALVLFSLVILRFGYYKSAARTLILLFIAAPWAAVLIDPSMLNRDIVPLLYITLPILLSTLFLTLTETALTAGAQFILLVILALNNILPNEANAFSLLVYVFLVSAVSILINYVRDDEQQRLLTQAHKLENSREKLQRQSILDPVTGLYNRAHLERLLDDEMMRAENTNTTVGFLMIDVDHFKTINDTYGHSTGDLVLREIGQMLSNHIRQTDYLIRHGGDELVIMMPGASTRVALRRAEQFRADVEALEVLVEGQIINSVSLSIGVATYPEHGKTKDALIGAADQAMHEAKASGRNRVVMAAKNLFA